MTAKQEEFLQVYAAHFGALRESDGQSYWLAWIDKDRTSIDLVIAVIERLAAQYDDGKFAHKPKLGTFQRLYAEMGGKTRTETFNSSEGCTGCRNTGKLHMVMAGDTVHKAMPMIRNVRWFGYMAVTLIPCNCELGKSINEAQGGPGFPRMYLDRLVRDCSFPYGHSADVFLDACRAVKPPEGLPPVIPPMKAPVAQETQRLTQ